MTMDFNAGGWKPVPVIPGPLDTAAIWGANRETGVPSEGRPNLSPGRPPWEPEPEKDRGWTLALIVLGLLFIVVAGVFGFAIQRADVAPVWVPLVGKDTGVAACEALAGGDKVTTLNAGDGRVRDSKMDEKEYQQIRGIFGDSRHAEIREPGQDLIDYAWQLQGIGPDGGLLALPLIGSIQKAYAGLSGGCAEHGYTIPAFGSR